uniref:Serine-threonine/tyrosine-protein kinase catalytic domain-containing protein n=1 Tax=Megaselia scalaris TaxID=36166 RepID=T1GU63_MEGSC
MYSLGEAPYAGEGGVDTIKKIEDGYRLPRPNMCSETTYDMMTRCWYYNPKDRPTFRILKDFFTSDYSNLNELVSFENIE